MNRLHETRRWILGVLIVMVAAAALGTGHEASAADGTKFEDSGSKEEWKQLCEDGDGVFLEADSGRTECHYDDGAWADCDANGQDCWYYPPQSKHQPTDVNDPFFGTGDEATMDVGGTESPPPPGDNPPPPTDSPSIAAPADDQNQDRDKRQGKKGKKGKKGGKRRK